MHKSIIRYLLDFRLYKEVKALLLNWVDKVTDSISNKQCKLALVKHLIKVIDEK